MLPTIILPDARGGQVRPQESREDFLRRWHEDYAAGREIIPPPENIRFEHDPLWRERPLSMEFIRSAYEGKHLDRPAAWFWLGISLLFGLSAASWAMPLGRQLGLFFR